MVTLVILCIHVNLLVNPQNIEQTSMCLIMSFSVTECVKKIVFNFGPNVAGLQLVGSLVWGLFHGFWALSSNNGKSYNDI